MTNVPPRQPSTPAAPMERLRDLNVPAAIVLATTVVSILTSVVCALVFVPSTTWEKIGHLPWSTIAAVGVPAVVGAISAIRQAWHGPVMPRSP